MTPFWRGAEGYLQGRPLANERDKGSRRHWLPGGVGRHGIAFERLKQPARWSAEGTHPEVGRHGIAFERLKQGRIAYWHLWPTCGWNTCYRVGAFEAVLGSPSGCLSQTARRSSIALERLKLGQCQLVRLRAFKVGRSVSASERSKVL